MAEHSASLKSLVDGVYVALVQDDIPRAMHLSWLLMLQPYCPLHMQARAVLIHSAASLTLGGDAEVIENNLQAMVKRLGAALSKPAMHVEETPWNVKALEQLRAALNSLRSSRKANLFRSHPHHYPHHLRELDSLVEGFGRMDLGCIRDDMLHDGIAGRVDPWRKRQA